MDLQEIFKKKFFIIFDKEEMETKLIIIIITITFYIDQGRISDQLRYMTNCIVHNI